MKYSSPIIFTLLFCSVGIASEDETIGEMLKRMKAQGSDKVYNNKADSDLPADRQFSHPVKKRVDYSNIKPPAMRELDDQGEVSDTDRLERVTDQQIAELYKIAEKLKNSPNRGEVWLRLAELYIEKAAYVQSRKQKEYESKLKQYNDKKASIKPKVDNDESKTYNNKAIQLYEYFIRDFNGDPKMDQALYFLGYNYFEVEDVSKGTAYYKRLIDEHPKSNYVTEANFSVAEYYFDNEKWDKAFAEYSKVIKSKNPRLYAFGLYKGAWCLYKMKRASDGIRYLESIIRLAKNQRESGDQGSKELKMSKLDEEAKRDLVLFFIDGGEVEKANDYFRNLLGDRASTELEKLGYYYSEKGFKDKANFLFRDLVNQNKMSPKAFDYQYQIVSNHSNLTAGQKFKEELYILVREYGPDSAWYKENSENKPVIENSIKVTESFLRSYILQQHQTAQNSKGKFSQEAALEGYKLYLNDFKSSPHYTEMMFYYGELLYDVGKFGDAAEQYAWVAKNGAKTKYGSKASMNMILGLEKDLPPEEELLKRSKNNTEKLDLDPKVKKFIENAEWYLTNYPKGDKNVELRFKIARLYYLSNHFDEAEVHFKKVVATAPKSKQAEYSTNLLLDIYNLKKDYKGLEKAAEELLKNPNAANSQSANEVKSILEKASFKAGSDLEEHKDYMGSADKFMEFAKKYPNSPLTPSARFNAGVNYERANRVALSLAAFETVLKSSGGDAPRLQEKTYKILPRMYQDLGYYSKAAEANVVAAEKAGKDKSAANYYYNAALLYDALNNVDKAVKNYQIYYKLAPERDRPDIQFKIADLYKRNKMHEMAINFYKSYVASGKEPEKIVESQYSISKIYKDMHDTSKSNYWASQTVKRQQELVPKLKGPGAQFAAKIRFGKAEMMYNELKAVDIPAEAAKMKKATDKKLNLLNQLNTELTEIIKYDSSEEIVGSLSLLGRANDHLADAFLKAPIPKEIKDEAQIKQYQEIIKENIKPFQAKSFESFKAAIKQARDLETYNEYYFLSLNYIKEVDPGFAFDKGEKAFLQINSDWMGVK
jgi:TolA-binding protein/tetratricopeptide (TPR) repeat protein